MKIRLGLCFLFGCTVTCLAADDAKQRRLELNSIQLGDYSVTFDSDVPRYGAPDPSGLTPLARETVKPFLGLKLSAPLQDNFSGVGGPDGR